MYARMNRISDEHEFLKRKSKLNESKFSFTEEQPSQNTNRILVLYSTSKNVHNL